MENLSVRHFLLAKDFKVNTENLMFTAKNIYEYFQAPQYPASIDIKAILGICFLNPGREYHVEVKIIQNETLLGGWKFPPLTVEKPNEIMNIHMGTRGRLVIPKEGFVQFDIYVNDEKINTQYVQAVMQGEQ